MKKASEQTLHYEALPIFARDALERCSTLLFFANDGWYLAGGTALALQAGHRQSQDLDFFTTEKMFAVSKAEQTLGQEKSWQTESKDEAGTLYGELLQAKMSLIAYPFFQPAEKMRNVGTVSLAAPQDIAAMKIAAISQRGRKRDFVDLYWLSQHTQSLSESFERSLRHYTIKQNPSHILKSLTYFDDAENDPMPTLFFKANWEEIKKYFRTEVVKIAKDLFQIE